MRVALVTTSYPRGPGDAAGHFVEAEARARARSGDEVTVLAPAASGGVEPGNPRVVWLEAGDAFGWPGALERLRRAPWRAVGAVRFVLGVRAALARERFDEVIAHWLVPSAWPAAGRAGAALEIVCHGTDVALLERLPARASAELFGALERRGARYRCVSADLAARLRALAPRLDPSRVRVEPAPFALLGGLARPTARVRLGVDPAERLIVVVGRLVPAKRVDTALRSATLVPRARVVVLGDGPLRSALEAARPRVEFLGQVPRHEALEWLVAADVLLSASAHEGAPTVVREARALGTSVVATSAGDLETWAAADPGLSVVASAAGRGAPRTWP